MALVGEYPPVVGAVVVVVMIREDASSSGHVVTPAERCETTGSPGTSDRLGFGLSDVGELLVDVVSGEYETPCSHINVPYSYQKYLFLRTWDKSTSKVTKPVDHLPTGRPSPSISYLKLVTISFRLIPRAKPEGRKNVER